MFRLESFHYYNESQLCDMYMVVFSYLGTYQYRLIIRLTIFISVRSYICKGTYVLSLTQETVVDVHIVVKVEISHYRPGG